jgi:hypothetical protein
MLQCALRWPRTIGGGSGSACATVACAFADGRAACDEPLAAREAVAGELAAITDTIRKHAIAMLAPT